MFAERDGIPFAGTLSAGLPAASVTAPSDQRGWTDEEIARRVILVGRLRLEADPAR